MRDGESKTLSTQNKKQLNQNQQLSNLFFIQSLSFSQAHKTTDCSSQINFDRAGNCLDSHQDNRNNLSYKRRRENG